MDRGVTTPIPTVQKALISIARQLTSAGIENTRREAAILVAHVTGLSSAQLLGRPERGLRRGELENLTALTNRRAAGEPMAYLVGIREFWSLPFHVDSSVLIPRPETECLIEACLERMPIDRSVEVLEIGVGSGAIVGALATERPRYEFTATDVSPEALVTARLNLTALELLDRIKLAEGDLYTPVGGRAFEWIVSNPPYVSRAELAQLMVDVRDYEPELAIVAGEDGLGVIRRLVTGARAHLLNQGKLAIEHGATQQDEIALLMESAGFEVVVRGRDYAGLPRFVIAELSRRRS